MRSSRFLAAFFTFTTSLAILGGGCHLPTRTDWNRCTPQDPSCLVGSVCDQTTWRCVALSDGGSDGVIDRATDAGTDGTTDGVTDGFTDGIFDGGSDSPADSADRPDTGPPPCTRNATCLEIDKPVCELATGKCVGCLVSTQDCAAPYPVCDPGAKACVGCLQASDCTAAAPACFAGTKTCVECVADSDCSGTKPLCDKTAHRCTACSADSQCSAKDATHAACATTGACVGCVVSKTHCPTMANPICDADTSTCRGCKHDNECALAHGAEPGLCVAGACATQDAVLYVHNDSPRCTASTVGDGSATAPFCTPADAVAHITPARHTLLLRGPEPLRSFSLAATATPVLVAGQAGARVSVLSGTDTAYVTITSGDVKLRDLTIGGSDAGMGVNATGGVLRMNRCQVLDNPEGGVSTKNAGFEILNSVFAGNGKLGANAVVLGAAPAAGPTTFAFDTVVDNAGIGVFCSQAYPIGNVISSGNALAFSKDCAATDACATTCSPAPMLSATRPYVLTASSAACLDAATGTLTLVDDLADTERPWGRASDCGASEYRPLVTVDASTTDSSSADANGSTDASSTDASSTDASSTDASSTDASSADASTP